MKQQRQHSLIVKISLIVVLAELVILIVIGIYYTNRFSLEIDRQLHTQIQLPGMLMNRQLLKYNAVTDKVMMTELIGEEVVDACIVGMDQRIYYSLHVSDIGMVIKHFPAAIVQGIEEKITEHRILRITNGQNTFLVSLIPLTAYNGAAPFYYVFIKINTNYSEHRKRAVAVFFIAGSVLGVGLTSLLIIWALRGLITLPLSQLEESARNIKESRSERILLSITRNDELGSLARSFIQMRSAIREKIRQLEEFNRTLEAKVDEKTQELQEYIIRLQQEIAERKQAEEALRMGEARLRSYIDHAPTGVFVADEQGRYLEVNPAACAMTGYTANELLSMSIPDLVPPEADETAAQHFQHVVDTGQAKGDFAFKRKNGEIRYWRVDAVKLSATRYMGFTLDITERKQAEQALRNSEKNFKSIIENSSNLFYKHDTNHILSYLSPQVKVILGYKPEEAMVAWTSMASDHPINQHGHALTQQAINTGQRQPVYELELVHKSGKKVWVEVREAPVVEHGRTVAIVGALTDITKRKQAEEHIQASLKEKEVLLREIHHRVKNNLMVVTSLIQMQSEQTSDPEALALFRDLHNRVMAMTMVHEDLYQSDMLSQIDFGAYLERLVHGIHRGFARTVADIHIDAENIFLNVQQAIPCGLVVAELVTNAFKYAFPSSVCPNTSMLESEKRAEICVELRRNGQNYTLIVRDNGIGMSSDVDWRNPRTLGLELVQSWATHQLKGKIQVDTQPGTQFTITFREKREHCNA